MSLVINLRLKGRVNIWDLTKAAIRTALDNAVSRINQGEISHFTPGPDTNPYSKGSLRGTFYADIRGDTIRLIWPETYAELVDKGAMRHTIQPKQAGGIIAFPDRAGLQFGRKDYDGYAYVKYVLNHPGQRGQLFGMRTSRAAYAIIRDEIINEIARIEM